MSWLSRRPTVKDSVSQQQQQQQPQQSAAPKDPSSSGSKLNIVLKAAFRGGGGSSSSSSASAYPPPPVSSSSRGAPAPTQQRRSASTSSSFSRGRHTLFSGNPASTSTSSPLAATAVGGGRGGDPSSSSLSYDAGATTDAVPYAHSGTNFILVAPGGSSASGSTITTPTTHPPRRHRRRLQKSGVVGEEIQIQNGRREGEGGGGGEGEGDEPIEVDMSDPFANLGSSSGGGGGPGARRRAAGGVPVPVSSGGALARVPQAVLSRDARRTTPSGTATNNSNYSQSSSKPVVINAASAPNNAGVAAATKRKTPSYEGLNNNDNAPYSYSYRTSADADLEGVRGPPTSTASDRRRNNTLQSSGVSSSTTSSTRDPPPPPPPLPLPLPSLATPRPAIHVNTANLRTRAPASASAFGSTARSSHPPASGSGAGHAAAGSGSDSSHTMRSPSRPRPSTTTTTTATTNTKTTNTKNTNTKTTNNSNNDDVIITNTDDDDADNNDHHNHNNNNGNNNNPHSHVPPHVLQLLQPPARVASFTSYSSGAALILEAFDGWHLGGGGGGGGRASGMSMRSIGAMSGVLAGGTGAGVGSVGGIGHIGTGGIGSAGGGSGSGSGSAVVGGGGGGGDGAVNMDLAEEYAAAHGMGSGVAHALLDVIGSGSGSYEYGYGYEAPDGDHRGGGEGEGGGGTRAKNGARGKDERAPSLDSSTLAPGIIVRTGSVGGSHAGPSSSSPGASGSGNGNGGGSGGGNGGVKKLYGLIGGKSKKDAKSKGAKTSTSTSTTAGTGTGRSDHGLSSFNSATSSSSQRSERAHDDEGDRALGSTAADYAHAAGSGVIPASRSTLGKRQAMADDDDAAAGPWPPPASGHRDPTAVPVSASKNPGLDSGASSEGDAATTAATASDPPASSMSLVPPLRLPSATRPFSPSQPPLLLSSSSSSTSTSPSPTAHAPQAGPWSAARYTPSHSAGLPSLSASVSSSSTAKPAVTAPISKSGSILRKPSSGAEQQQQQQQRLVHKPSLIHSISLLDLHEKRQKQIETLEAHGGGTGSPPPPHPPPLRQTRSATHSQHSSQSSVVSLGGVVELVSGYDYSRMTPQVVASRPPLRHVSSLEQVSGGASSGSAVGPTTAMIGVPSSPYASTGPSRSNSQPSRHASRFSQSSTSYLSMAGTENSIGAASSNTAPSGGDGARSSRSNSQTQSLSQSPISPISTLATSVGEEGLASLSVAGCGGCGTTRAGSEPNLKKLDTSEDFLYAYRNYERAVTLSASGNSFGVDASPCIELVSVRDAERRESSTTSVRPTAGVEEVEGAATLGPRGEDVNLHPDGLQRANRDRRREEAAPYSRRPSQTSLRKPSSRPSPEHLRALSTGAPSTRTATSRTLIPSGSSAFAGNSGPPASMGDAALQSFHPLSESQSSSSSISPLQRTPSSPVLPLDRSSTDTATIPQRPNTADTASLIPPLVKGWKGGLAIPHAGKKPSLLPPPRHRAARPAPGTGAQSAPFKAQPGVEAFPYMEAPPVILRKLSSPAAIPAMQQTAAVDDLVRDTRAPSLPSVVSGEQHPSSQLLYGGRPPGSQRPGSPTSYALMSVAEYGQFSPGIMGGRSSSNSSALALSTSSRAPSIAGGSNTSTLLPESAMAPLSGKALRKRPSFLEMDSDPSDPDRGPDNFLDLDDSPQSPTVPTHTMSSGDGRHPYRAFT